MEDLVETMPPPHMAFSSPSHATDVRGEAGGGERFYIH